MDIVGILSESAGGFEDLALLKSSLGDQGLIEDSPNNHTS
jgi:hypothetical protein